MEENKDKLNISESDLQSLVDAMNTKYRLARGERKFQVQAKHQDKGVYVTVLLADAEEKFYYPVEARIRHESEEMSPRTATLFLLDYIDMYFEEYLLEEDESIYIPIDWTDHQYEAVDFQIRGQILNRKLENLADAWLARAEQ
ncbi:MAG: hypothetical protein ACOH5I_19410 [Oligoflexus sp.]